MSTGQRIGLAWRNATTATNLSAGSIAMVVVVCGVFSEYFIEDVVGAIGWFARHDESTLRLLGWCWGAGPWIGCTLLLKFRPHLSEEARHYLGLGLLSLAATGFLHLPGRRESTREHYLSVWADGMPLGYGWTWGVANLFVFVFVMGVVAKLRRGLGPDPTIKLTTIFLGRGSMVVWVILLAASLGAALLVPRP